MWWFQSVYDGSFLGSTLISSSLLWSGLVMLGIIVFMNKKRKWDRLNKLPGPKTFPLLGNALEFNVAPTEQFKAITGKLFDPKYSLCRIWLGWVPYCFVYKAKAVEVILSSSKYIEKSFDYRYLHSWLGTGLLTAKGTKWHGRRKMLTPTFHFKILENYVEVFNQQSSILVNILAINCDTGQSFDIFPYITLCTLDIILETAMGRSINAQQNSDSEYVKAIYKISEIIQQRQLLLRYQSDFLFGFTQLKKEHDKVLQYLHGFSNKVILEKREELRNAKHTNTDDHDEDVTLGKKKRLAFMDLLLEYSENENLLSNEDIRQEVDTFMFEGHDTTSAAINWAIYCFGAHPDIQEEIYKEIISVLNDTDSNITSADLKEMKYLDCCIKEALRLYPSVPIFGRQINEDVVIDDFTVPSGTNVMIVPHRLHRDPDQFPDPEAFKPERFFPENSGDRHPYAYIPFSAGPRNCIGQKFAQMEDKIVLVNLLRNYRFESVVKEEDLKLLGQLILRPENGNMMKIFKRK